MANVNNVKKKPTAETLRFGYDFTDHMLRIQWNHTEGWKRPQITPLTYFKMHPAARVLHYAQEIYEGMKVKTILIIIYVFFHYLCFIV